MLTEKQLKEIREHLSKAQNPLFFFHDDQDGLCSFLLLQRYIGRGRGVAVKNTPELTGDYFKKAEELKPDYIFVLDQPEVSREFFKEVEQVNIPLVWIDHHDIDKEIPKFISYYNPMLNKTKSNEPVTYLCYKISKKKEDLWIAVVGSISDAFYPEFYEEFKEEYPDLSIDSKSAFDIFYKSGVGTLSKLMGHGLKDRTTNVVKMLKFLIGAKNPYEVLEENTHNFMMHKRFKEVNDDHQRLLKKAKAEARDHKVLFFNYGGDTSMSANLSNELKYLFPDKIIIVAYTKGARVNISARGNTIRKIVLKAIDGLPTATGGGHEKAVGAQVRVEDLDEFRKRIEKFAEEK